MLLICNTCIAITMLAHSLVSRKGKEKAPRPVEEVLGACALRVGCSRMNEPNVRLNATIHPRHPLLNAHRVYLNNGYRF